MEIVVWGSAKEVTEREGTAHGAPLLGFRRFLFYDEYSCGRDDHAWPRGTLNGLGDAERQAYDTPHVHVATKRPYVLHVYAVPSVV